MERAYHGPAWPDRKAWLPRHRLARVLRFDIWKTGIIRKNGILKNRQPDRAPEMTHPPH